ncbi:MAG: glycerol-3-phosphate 1-O-acyltransferase PlsY [Clostridiales bacterium]|nr:glycerol-3-phosphate 1-O-acyltransferase PlsY [Candidatus Apopatousia equi]
MNIIDIIKLVVLVICSYLMGNISFARLISKFKKDDITKSGSGNPGTMNMLRTYGVKLGALTLVCDVLKGAIPAFAGLMLFGYGTTAGTIGLYIAGVSVIIGHIYPVFYKFKGGKGIACTLGVFLVADPMWLLIFFAIAFVYLYIFDYGSVASLTIVSALTIIQGVKNYGNVIISLLLFVIFTLTWFAHRSNITRLLLGKENKANLQKSLKKKFSKQNRQFKTEYLNSKQEIKTEYLKDADKKDKEKYKEEKLKYIQEKRHIKDVYIQKRRKVYNYANIVEIVSTQEQSFDKDNE